jgi:hypothetical protein
MNEIANNTTSLPATLTGRITALRARTGNAIKLWNPKPGDTLVGVLTESQRLTGECGDNYQIRIVDEKFIVHAIPQKPWLRNELSAQGAVVGDLVSITSWGKAIGSPGRKGDAYSIVVEKV